MKAITIRLPKHIAETVEREADYNERSTNAQIIYWLKLHIEQEQRIRSGKSQLDVSALAGEVESRR